MIAGIVSSIVDFYVLLVFAYVIMSWFRPRDGVFYDVYAILGNVCEPYLGLFRRIVPVTSGIDFSPLVAILVLQYLIRPAIIMVAVAVGL